MKDEVNKIANDIFGYFEKGDIFLEKYGDDYKILFILLVYYRYVTDFSSKNIVKINNIVELKKVFTELEKDNNFFSLLSKKINLDSFNNDICKILDILDSFTFCNYDESFIMYGINLVINKIFYIDNLSILDYSREIKNIIALSDKMKKELVQCTYDDVIVFDYTGIFMCIDDIDSQKIKYVYSQKNDFQIIQIMFIINKNALSTKDVFEFFIEFNALNQSSIDSVNLYLCCDFLTGNYLLDFLDNIKLKQKDLLLLCSSDRNFIRKDMCRDCSFIGDKLEPRNFSKRLFEKYKFILDSILFKEYFMDMFIFLYRYEDDMNLSNHDVFLLNLAENLNNKILQLKKIIENISATISYNEVKKFIKEENLSDALKEFFQNYSYDTCRKKEELKDYYISFSDDKLQNNVNSLAQFNGKDNVLFVFNYSKNNSEIGVFIKQVQKKYIFEDIVQIYYQNKNENVRKRRILPKGEKKSFTYKYQFGKIRILNLDNKKLINKSRFKFFDTDVYTYSLEEEYYINLYNILSEKNLKNF